MRKGDKARGILGIWGLIVVLVILGVVFGGLIVTASATDYENIILESCTVFKCQNCESYKVVTDPWNYPDTTALCYVHKGQYYAWTGETYGGWRKIWVAPYSNDYKGTTGWIYEGTYWARETKTVLRAKTTLAVYKSPGSGLYGYIYSGQKFYYLGSSGEWFKIQMCGDTAGGGAMQGWVHGLSTREITVTSPNGGENWQRGAVHAITWTSSNAGSYVKIELYKGGYYDRTITSSTSNDGSYSWSIPSTLATGTNYKIKITSTSYTDVSDMSNSYFTISKREITVTSPNGGENWQRGAVHAITWTSSNAGSYVKIELYKGGYYDRTITSSTSNDGSYSWSIPSTLATGTNYKIKITSTSYTDVSDMSNSYFTISKVQTQVKGIDVSHWQGDIDWSQVYNAGYRFAFAKATGGDASPPQIIDDHFETNMNEGHNAGMLMGSYHFAYPQYNDAVDEAHFFVSVAGEYFKEGYLRPALDMEEGGGYLTNEELSNWIHEWMNTVKNETGIEPILYVNSNYANNYLDSSISKYDLWIAHWTYDPSTNPSTGIWDDWDFWQYSDKGSVSGISGDVDLDLFNGDMSRLNTFVISGGDHIPPTVDAFDVTPRSVTLGNSFTISYTVSDTGGSGLKQVELWRKSTGDWEQIGDPTSLVGEGDGPYSGSFSDSPSSVGTYWYGIHVVDNTGNWAPEDSPIEVEVTQPIQPPQITTNAASGVGTTSATLNGNLDSTGGEDCQVWFQYGKTTSYSDFLPSKSKSSTGSFSDVVSGLDDDTTYHFRAVASNSEGTVFGSDMTFKTDKEIDLPQVTTNAAALVEETTATLNGVINSDGGEACQYRFEYDTNSGEPYASNTGWTGSKTTGQSFNAAIPSLAKGTKYYFRAQARNSAGTASGSELTFLTKPDAPTSFSATTAGTTQIDLSWTKGAGAQKTKIQRKQGSYPSNKDDGTQVYFDIGTSTPDTGLTPGTTYYYRAWSYVQGSEQWSDSYAQDWATTTSIGAPTVTTSAATLVEETTATLNGVINNDGGEACQYRFEYDTNSGEPYAYNTGWTGSKTTGQSFSEAIPSLAKGTKYYFRAQAKNSAGTAGGSELTFLTKPDAPTSFSATTAGTTQIDLSWTKGAGAQKTKIQRKQGSYPSNKDDGTQVYFDTGTSTPDTGLTEGTTYYYRAWSYVQGSEQWSDNYAQASATTTSIDLPQVTTDAASGVGTTSATLNGNLDDTGGESCQVWFEYGKTTSYGSSTSPESKSSTGSFSKGISGLDDDTTYHFRAVASNSEGTDYGDDKIFTTSKEADTTPPTWDTTVGIQSATDTGKGGQVEVTYGTATDAGSPPVKYNVYYSTSSPATAGTKLSNVCSSPYTVTGLTNGLPYYFSVRAEDSATPPNEDTNTVELTATPTLIDTTPPAAITDLATSSPTSNLITLTWTAPGDDGNSGTATSYDIRYSTSMITGANWAAATQATGEPTPSMAGTAETFTVTGLTPSTTHYFAIKTADEAPNESPLSNVVSGTTSAMPDTTPPYTSGHAPSPNTVNVPIDTNIVVHVMDDGAGVDQATIVMTVEGAVVTPVIVGSPADYTLTYDPPIDFAYNQVVDVTIDASDLASPSNIMTQDSYSFTTVADITPPTITSASPTDGATGVPVTTTISATFSEAMNTASVEAAFSITSGVAGTFSWVENTMTFTSGENLAYSTTYTVTIAATATDLAGNPLVAPYTWAFTTAPSGQVLTAIRDISSQQVIIGSTFTVTVTITANQTIYALILDEDPPIGWAVTPVQNDGATFKVSEIRWLWTESLSEGDSKTVIYNVTIPSDTTQGDYTITGNASAYGIEPTTVGGDNTITVITDWNPWDDDGTITDGEIQEVVYCWLTDTPKNDHLITDSEIQKLVYMWLTG